MDSHEDLLIKDAQRPKSPLWEKVVIIVLAFVGVGLLGMVLAFVAAPEGLPGVDKTDTPQTVAQVVEEKELTGTLISSFTSFDSSTGNNLIVTGLIKTASNEAVDMPIDQLGTKKAMTQQYNISSGFEYVTFLGLTSDDQDGASWNIYRTQIHQLGDLPFIVATIESNSPFFKGDETDYFREFPVVSREGTVLYSSLTKEAYAAANDNVETLTAETWSIFAIAQDGSKTKLIQGLRPKWINNNTFAYLKNDGVYAMNLATMEERKIFAHSSTITLLQGFDVSNDGTHFAFTDPVESKVIVAEVKDWGTGILSPTIELPFTASNPVFSPDNSHLAMVRLHPNETNPDAAPTAKIEYFSIAKQKFTPNAMALEPLTISGVYLTDWQ